MDYRGSIIKNEKQKFGNTVFIEILPYMDFMGEFQWLTDDKKYYLNRYTYYGGLYFNVLNTKKVIFKQANLNIEKEDREFTLHL